MNSQVLRRARSFVRRVCTLAGQWTWIQDVQHEAAESGLIDAVRSRDTAAIYGWMMHALNHQGISDSVADSYLAEHGNVTWADIEHAVAARPSCNKLAGYWAFTDCAYRKGEQACNAPEHFPKCPLPRHVLRNGRLNQTAYSLFFFIRDVGDGDLVAWIDRQLADPLANDLSAARAALIDPLRNVYGISDKVIAMALSSLLVGAGGNRSRWFGVGASFVVVDTLVHNFLVRTGILQSLQASHPYGPACYRPGGCAEVLTTIAAGIDAQQFNPTFPKVFPRFVQHSIWRYCAQSCLDICNGNRINDIDRCENMWCSLYSRCARLPLQMPAKRAQKEF